MEDLLKELDLRDVKAVNNANLSYYEDYLTHVFSRQYIMEIANGMLKKNIPFSIAIIDIDNFKQINDTYGHLLGDFVLEELGKKFKEIAQKIGYVGRYGGDEFLLLIPNLTDYEDLHNFLENLYDGSTIFRKYYNNGQNNMYVTASIGSATFPKDAACFEELFIKADKALYRAKSRGRSCFVIYLEEKHKNISIREKTNKTVLEKFLEVQYLFTKTRSIEKVIRYSVDYLYNYLHCSGVYFLNQDNSLIGFNTNKFFSYNINFEPHLEALLACEKIFYDTPLKKYMDKDIELKELCESKSIFSLMVSKVSNYDTTYGYFLIYEMTNERIWQEDEIALVLYISTLIENHLNYKKSENN